MAGTADDQSPRAPGRIHHFEAGQPYSGHTRGSLFTGVSAVCDTATRLAGVDGAAVAVFAPSQSRELVYATDAVAQQVDELQFTVGEGPCLDAYRAGAPELCPRLDDEVPMTRWPAFCNGAGELGVGAVFAYPILAPKRSFGVLELYRRTAGGLDRRQHESATLCAIAIAETLLTNWGVHVAAAVDAGAAGDVSSAGAQVSLGSDNDFSRATVYVASGMVAVQLNVSADDGLDLLRAHAFSHNRSIAELAADIVARRVSLRDPQDDPKDDR